MKAFLSIRFLPFFLFSPESTDAQARGKTKLKVYLRARLKV